MRKAKDIVKYKDVEIEWCWEMFDRILVIIDGNSSSDDKIIQIKNYANYGLKGRKDEFEE
jgi:hypothetical protein